MSKVRIVEEVARDVRYGLRQLRWNPGFTAVALLTLALGIGANIAIFSVVDAVVLRPLPYPHSRRLVWISDFVPALGAETTGGADYFNWKDRNKTLSQITAYNISANFNLSGRGVPVRVHGARVSASFFRTLAVRPQLGRGFTRKEDQPNGPNVVVLMHSFWQEYFGSDREVLGRTVTLDAAPYTIIGVMPASFKFPGDPNAQLLVPLGLDKARELLRLPGGQFFETFVNVIGRLKPGVTLAQARNDLTAIRKHAESTFSPAPPPPNQIPGGGAPPGAMRFFHRLVPPSAGPMHAGNIPRGAPPAAMLRNAPFSKAPQPFGRHFGAPPPTEVRVVPLEQHLAGNFRSAMMIMLGVVGLVLLIACANVANLTLARASARNREMAVRAALGAGRWRLARQLLTESVLLALAGGAAGVAVAAWGVRAMTRLIPPAAGGNILSLAQPHMDLDVLLFALAISVATGIIFGLAPAVAASRTHLAERLKEASGTGAGPRRGRLRGTLAVAELSLALVILVGAGLLMKSFYRVLSVHLGFAPEHVLAMNLNLASPIYSAPAQQTEFFSQVLSRVESLPGVRSAALADSLPLSHYRIELMIARERLAHPGQAPNTKVIHMSRIVVSPGYFYTLGIPLLEGRTFTDHDDQQSAKVAVVNQELARHFWPGENPIGHELPLFTGKLRVVGVVGNTRHEGPGAKILSEIYVPCLQSPESSMQLAIRTSMDPASLAGAVRREVASMDPTVPVSRVATLDERLSESVAPRRFNMLLLALFAGIALALAAVGIYGVMAYSVTLRTHEIGVRMALGAQKSDVLRMVVGEGLKLAIIGVAIGVTGALLLTRFLSSWLFGVKPTDPFTFAAVSALLMMVGLVACYIPARRAAQVDPIATLRCE